MALRKIRATDTTLAALAYNFRLGAWIFAMPFVYYAWTSSSTWSPLTVFYVIVSGLCGILGQAALTYGYRYTTAVQGSVISSSRMIIALVVGIFFWLQPVFWQNLLGAGFIMAANVMLSEKKN